MIRRTTTALLFLSLMLILAACQSGPKAEPGESDYENLSPLLNEQDPFAADAPSLKGLGRRHWPQITYRLGDNRVAHDLTCFGDVDRGDDAIDVLLPPTVEWRIAEAMSGATADNWNASHALDAVIAPLRATGHAAVLPIALVVGE